MNSTPTLSYSAKSYCITLVLLLCSVACAKAEETLSNEYAVKTDTAVSRPVYQVYSIGIGNTHCYDTYLSPLKYEGVALTLHGAWQKAFTSVPQHFSMSYDADVMLGMPHNPSNHALMTTAALSFDFGVAYREKLPYDITVSAGLATGFDTAILYLSRNSNNPVSAKATAALSLTAAAYYPLKIGNLPIRISEQISLPSLGVFFSPAFGETYYEIYLGNRSGLCHPSWWGNNFSLRNLLSVELDLGRTGLQLGYSFNCKKSDINYLHSRIVTHAFVIGVIPHGLGMRPPKPRKIIRTITPFD